MGTEDNRQLEQLERKDDSSKAGNPAGDGSRRGSNPNSTKANGNGNGDGGRNPDRGSGGAGGEAKEKELPELALLNEEEKQIYLSGDKDEQKRVLHNARKRARYAKNKQNTTGEEVKPRKVNNNKAKAKSEAPIDVTQLNLIFMGISSAVASRPNCQHWLLTEQEINSITVPLSKMLAESTMFSGMGEYSNQIALVMACITVFAPRLMLTVQKSKEVKRNARTGQTTNTNVKRVPEGGASPETKRSNSKPDNRNELKPSANGTADAQSVPFYGVPIC